MPRLLPHVAAELFCQPLLVQDTYLETLLTAIHDRVDIEPLVSQSVLESNHRPTRYSYLDPENQIAIVPIVGGLTHRSGYDSASGSTGYVGIQRELTRLVAEGAKGFVLDMDTPGGSVPGITQTGEFIKKLAAEFPVYAVANELMASAGYWIGSTATRVYAAKLASVGSIGVTTAHIDRSEQMKRMGVVVTHISAGARKTDGSPFGPLTEEALAGIQARINGIYNAFIDHVAVNRGLDEKAVRDTEAGVFAPDEAKNLGLIDGVAGLDEAIDAMKTRLRSTMYPNVSFPSTKTGASTAMAENLIYSQVDLDAAVNKAVASNSTANAAALQAAREEGAMSAYTALTTALSDLFKGDARAESFVELIQDGMSPDKAAKHASKINASASPSQTPEAKFAASAPNVPVHGPAATEPTGQAVSGEPDRAAFLSSIGLSAKFKSPLATGAVKPRV